MTETIETARLLLTPPRLSEVPALFAFPGDLRAMRHTKCGRTVAECRRRITVHEWRRRRDGFARWTIRP